MKGNSLKDEKPSKFYIFFVMKYIFCSVKARRDRNKEYV